MVSPRGKATCDRLNSSKEAVSAAPGRRRSGSTGRSSFPPQLGNSCRRSFPVPQLRGLSGRPTGTRPQQPTGVSSLQRRLAGTPSSRRPEAAPYFASAHATSFDKPQGRPGAARPAVRQAVRLRRVGRGRQAGPGAWRKQFLSHGPRRSPGPPAGRTISPLVRCFFRGGGNDFLPRLLPAPRPARPWTSWNARSSSGSVCGQLPEFDLGVVGRPRSIASRR